MSHSDDPNPLAQPLRLASGVTLKNRIIKSAMSDSLGDGRGNPTDAQVRLYSTWASGGAALSIIGEVQVIPNHPEKPGNLVLGPLSDTAKLSDLADKGSANATGIWPQIGHAGALTYGPIGPAKGPSALDLDGLKSEALTHDEIAALPALYASAATRAKTAGFTGVQVHAAHGFLLSQFLSPLFNHREDAYGGSLTNRFRILGEVIDAVRKAVGPEFPIGIKINSTDALEGGLSGPEALDIVEKLDATSVDLIDISGGTYFPGAPASSEGTASTGAYYVEFAKNAKARTGIPLTLTGGIRTYAEGVKTVGTDGIDAVGLARALVLDPALPNLWANGDASDPAFPRFPPPPPGGITAWYSMRLTALGEDRAGTFECTPVDALATYEARDAERTALWRAHFGL